MISKIVDSDISDFIQAWEQAFERKLDSSVYNWIFDSTNNIYIFKDKDKAVAGYCLKPLDFLCNKNHTKGYLCNNVFVMTVPGFKYQRLKVFDQLSSFAYSDLGGDWVAFPNKIALMPHLRNGWSKALSLKTYELDWTSFKSVPRPKNSNLLINLSFNRFLELFSKANIITDNISFMVKKNSDFFKWRYQDNPRYKYDYFIYIDGNETLGYVITKFFPEKSRVHIVDFSIPFSIGFLNEILFQIGMFYDDFGFRVLDVLESPFFRSVLDGLGAFTISEEELTMIVKGDCFKNLNFHCAHIVFGDNEVY